MPMVLLVIVVTGIDDINSPRGVLQKIAPCTIRKEYTSKPYEEFCAEC